MLTLVKNAQIYTPDPIGKKDLLIAGGKIAAIEDEIIPNFPVDVEVIDAEGKILTPGFIDQHVHITGGGGEGGFATRTKEIDVSDLLDNGITTVVGVLGTDGITRSMEGLYAKAKALELEGVSTYIYSGSYQVPLVTMTGSVQRDMVLIDKVIGAGEIAIADHRSFHPTVDELARVASEARVGGMLSGKAGVVHLHMGDAEEGFGLIYKLLEKTAIPVTHFVPTHVNRSRRLLEEAVDFCKRGGTVDLTAGFEPEEGFAACVPAYEAMKYLIDHGVNPNFITFSSDGNGSKPSFNEKGELTGIEAASCRVLLEDMQKAVKSSGMTMETVLKAVTSNPARVLKLSTLKGGVFVSADADMVLMDREVNVEMVFAQGRRRQV